MEDNLKEASGVVFQKAANRAKRHVPGLNNKFSFIGGVVSGFIGLVVTTFISGEVLAGELGISFAYRILSVVIINIAIGAAGYAIIFKWLLPRGTVMFPDYVPPRWIHYALYIISYIGTFWLIVAWAFNR
jgi:hypothetical protein